MKKLFLLALTALCGAALTAGAFAAEIERLTPETPDYAELTALDERIVDWINELQEYDDSGITADVTADDLDWSQAYKMYVDESNLYGQFLQQEMTFDQIAQAADYTVWVLPVRAQDAVLSVTLAQGVPETGDDQAYAILTEKQLEQLREDEGNWYPTEIREQADTADWYEQQIEAAYSGTISRALILGGSPKLRSAVAILETPDDGLQAIPIGDPRPTGVDPADIGQGEAYPMGEFSAIIERHYGGTADGTAAAEEDAWPLWCLAGAAALALAGLAVYKKRI